MLKTRKIVSLVLALALVLSMAAVGIVSASAAEGEYYLVGSFNSWAPADGYQLSENPDAAGEYMLMGITLTEGDMCKVKEDNGEQNTGWYPDGVNNDYTVAESGTYNVYFRPDGQGGEDWHYGYFYLDLAETEDETEAPVDETEAPVDETEAPVDETEAPVDETEAPVDETEAPVDETEAPVDETEAPVDETEAPVTGGSTASVDGQTFSNVHVGDTITYDLYLDLSDKESQKFTALQGTLSFDSSKVKLLTSLEEDEDTGKIPFLPNLLGGVTVNDIGDAVKYNAAKDGKNAGYKFDTKKVLIHADFEVIGEGDIEIINTIEGLGYGSEAWIKNSEVLAPVTMESTASVDCPHEDETEEPTTAPETDEPTAEPETDEPTAAPETDEPVGDKCVVTVNDAIQGTSETRTYKVGDKFTVISTLVAPEGKKVNSIDVWQSFNEGDKCLTLLSDPVEDYDIVFPQLKDPTTNVTADDIIKANFSCAKYKPACEFTAENNILIVTEYEVTAPGTTSITTKINTLAFIDEENNMETAVNKGEVQDGETVDSSTAFDGEAPQPETDEPTAEPETDEPTAEPETEEPTAEPETEAPIEGNTYYLTGSIAGWGAKAEYKFTPTNNADAEEYGITGVTLTTSDMIKAIKTSKSGDAITDWYPDGMDNNITVDHDSTYTILFRPNGDGTAEDGWIYSWYAGEPGYEVGGGTNHYGYLFKLIDENAEPETEEPTTEPETEEPTTEPETEEPTTEPETEEPTAEPVTEEPQPEQKLWVVADGNWYAVEPGEKFTYTYYLSTGEKVCSLDAETFFDTDGLKLLTDTEDMEALFPIIKDAMILNDTVEGRLKYNYSAAKGKDFSAPDSVLITAEFEVTAEEGIYYINTYTHTVAGADEHRYKFKDEVIDELVSDYGVIENKEPQPEPQPTTEEPTAEPETDEPTTEPETEEPTTEPETEEPTTEPETDEPTTAPETDEPTTAPETEPETTAPTTTPTVAPTQGGTTSGGSTSTSTSVTTNTSTVKTGSTEMAIIFLMILVMAAGVVIYTKKRKMD